MSTVKDTNPDDLMNHFRGRSLKSILIFTLVVHIVVIGGTSIPFAIRAISGPDTDKLNDEERVQLAVKDASSAIRDIAEQYGIQPQELSDQFKGGRKPQTETNDDETTVETSETAETPTAPETADEEKSTYEKNLEKPIPGPELPPVEQADDLFE